MMRSSARRGRAHPERSEGSAGATSPLLAALFACAMPAIALGADATDTGAGLAQTTIGLAIVLALIFGVAWLVRRVGPLAGAAGAPIRVVASQAVGQRERVVVVELGEQWLVLGVAPGRVNALSTLPRGSLPERGSAPSFASLLARATGRDKA
jgi:flagellar protein FliO/FliZ